jgi:tubulin polyglutamylase TTLL5
VFQRVNHFPGSRELTRKDLLKKNIAKLDILCSMSSKKIHVDAFKIMPQTFILPHEYNKFVTAFYENDSGNGGLTNGGGSGGGGGVMKKVPNYWILKPVGLSRGRGISMISDVGAVKYDTQTVVQQYLKNPLLIDGFKW